MYMSSKSLTRGQTGEAYGIIDQIDDGRDTVSINLLTVGKVDDPEVNVGGVVFVVDMPRNQTLRLGRR